MEFKKYVSDLVARESNIVRVAGALEQFANFDPELTKFIVRECDRLIDVDKPTQVMAVASELRKLNSHMANLILHESPKFTISKNLFQNTAFNHCSVDSVLSFLNDETLEN